MGRDAGTLTFEEWVEYVFGWPVGEPEWYMRQDEQGQSLAWWRPEPVTIATYLAQLFEDAGFLAGRYTAYQLNQGFWYVAGTGSSYFQMARDSSVPIPLQQRWVRAIFPLYRDLFQRVCSKHLSHLDPGHANPLNSACYMFWDMDCLEGAAMFPGYEHLVDPIFEVLEQILTLPSPACRESALHGLGHLQLYHPQRVRRIIDDFLRACPTISPTLRLYARRARSGTVQ
jgi:hypothetical protein